MCITEYDEARTFAEQREEGLREGIEGGIKEGRLPSRRTVTGGFFITLRPPP